ncbi:MAG: hypothetical protein ACE5DM_04130 [Candidatus Nanoarchaeia archaeon]
MGIVVAAIGPQGNGKSTTVMNMVLGMDNVLNRIYGGSNILPSILLYDATPEGTISEFCDQSRAADIRKLKMGGYTAQYTSLAINPKARSTEISAMRSYDLVVVDTSSAEPDQVNDILTAADGVILVISPYDDEFVWHDYLIRARKSNPEAKLDQVVVSGYDPTNKADYRMHVTLEQILGAKGRNIGRWITDFSYSSDIEDSHKNKIPVYFNGMREQYDKLARRVLQTTILSKSPVFATEEPAFPVEDAVRKIEVHRYYV